MQQSDPTQGPGPVDLPRSRPLGGYVLAGIILVAILAVVGGLLLLAADGEPTVVPDLTGLTLEEARQEAEAAGLALVAPDERRPGEQIVTDQQPVPGTEVVTGDTVTVTVERPLQESRIPDVTGVSIETATELLREAGLAVPSVQTTSEPGFIEGTVARQEPAEGTLVAADESISLWVAERSVQVPDVGGLNGEEADRRLQEAGFGTEVLHESSDEGEPGTVVRQIPKAGTDVEPGAQVAIVVNGSSPSTIPGTALPSPLYRSLADTYAFPVLYPSFIPPQLRLASDEENPRHVAGSGGQAGFEVRYEHGGATGAGLALMEGNWFEAAGDSETTVDVRGRPADLSRDGRELMLFWREDGAVYAVRAIGLEDGEVIEFAQGLEPVPVR